MRPYARRFLAAHVMLAFLAVAAVGGGGWLAATLPTRAAKGCSERIPHGKSITAAWKTTELFVADVILAREPRCAASLGSNQLRTAGSILPFSTGYPPVSIQRASRDPKARQAVYMLSRRESGFVVLGADGRPEIPMLVGLAAPRAGRGAYNLVLVVEDGSWRVDRVRRVVILDR
jgi:hypothetical protein